MGAASTGGGADASRNRQFWVKGILKTKITTLEAKLNWFPKLFGVTSGLLQLRDERAIAQSRGSSKTAEMN
jgi:hypothetical protein